MPEKEPLSDSNDFERIYNQNHNIDMKLEAADYLKTSTFNSLNAEFFKNLNDFKSDFLFDKTESILAKPPNIYRQVRCRTLVFIDFGCR
jgi:hypothetical protein